MTQSAQFSSLVQSFFAQHLCEHKQVSPRTVTVYRDTFRLLFAFMKQRTGRTPSDLAIADLDAPAILAFLDHLETARSNHVRSRNLRLSAIRSFFRYASLRDIEHLAVANRVLAIPSKRTAHPLLTFLSRPEMDAIIAASDHRTWLGGRDHALLLTMYNTVARASELTALTCGQFSFGTTTLVQIHGKERHSYWISFRRHHKTTGTHVCRQACDLAFSLADVLLVIRTDIGPGPCTHAHEVGRVGPMYEPYPA